MDPDQLISDEVCKIGMIFLLILCTVHELITLDWKMALFSNYILKSLIC